jgi:hypothetical protein
MASLAAAKMRSPESDRPMEDPMAEQDIAAVQRQHSDALMARANVTGVGIGERAGRPVIQVLVERKLPLEQLRPEDVIPSELDGWETDVVEVGRPVALDREEGDGDDG